ncbi:MAG: RDD family protein [Firmicutes bacterium]|nr:RDD family protein [Bacillota bacterium]
MIFDIQKANIWKRAAAFLLDAIILSIISVGFAYVFSACLNYDGYGNELTACYEEYEKNYGIDFNISQKEYDELPDEKRLAYDEAFKALSGDEKVRGLYSALIQFALLITSLSIFLSSAIVEFFIPLFFGNGQTVGKKIFGLCVIKSNGVKVKPVQMFIRALLGKYTIETMIPVLIVIMIYFNSIGIVGPIIIFGIAVLQLIILAVTENNLLLHDLLAGTVVTDAGSQMIFRDEAEILEYKLKRHSEEAAHSNY